MSSLYAPPVPQADTYRMQLDEIRAACASMGLAELEATKVNHPDIRWRGIAAAHLDTRRATATNTVAARRTRRRSARARQPYREEI